MVKMADGMVSNGCSQRQDHANIHLFTEYQHEHDIQMVPKPTIHTWKADALKSSLPDPKLSLTPERSSKPPPVSVIGNSNKQITCIKTVASKTKLKQRVRFEIDKEDDNDCDTSVDIVVQEQTQINTDNPEPNISSGMTTKKAYCPQMYVNKTDHNPSTDNDLDVTQTEENSNCGNSESLPKYSETTQALKFLAIRESVQVKSDPPMIIDSVPAHARKCHAVKNVVVVREFENQSDPADYKFPFVDHGQSFEPENAFARPEFNSTLKISEELKDLKAVKPKVAETLKQRLKHSEETRCEINEKASVKVNQSRDVFGGLVQVQPDINRLCLEVEREANLKSKSKVQKSLKTNLIKRPDGSVCDLKVPDLLEFYTENRQKEIPDFNLSGIQIPEVNLLGADNATAFDIYRHNKVWETLNN